MSLFGDRRQLSMRPFNFAITIALLVFVAGCLSTSSERALKNGRQMIEEAARVSSVISLKKYYACGDISVVEISEIKSREYCSKTIGYFKYLKEEWNEGREHLWTRTCWTYATVTDVRPFDVRDTDFDYKAWSNESTCPIEMGATAD